MSVLEYANDVDKKIEDILTLCKKMDINVSNEDDMLSDDDIILLDNEIANIDEIEEEIEFEEEIKDSYENELEPVKNNNSNKKKKQVINKPVVKNNYQKQRKEMYKHKEKLQSNLNEDNDNVVLYSEGLTISGLANLLNISSTEIIKKLMSLGIMANLNASIDFDTAEIVCLDYNKTLKKDSTRDETNFEELEILML